MQQIFLYLNKFNLIDKNYYIYYIITNYYIDKINKIKLLYIPCNLIDKNYYIKKKSFYSKKWRKLLKITIEKFEKF